MNATDLLDPTGPNASMRRTLRPTVYRVARDAQPRNIRRGRDGHYYGEVRLVAESPETADPRHDTRDGRGQPPRPRPQPPAVRDIEGHDQRPDPMQAATTGAYVRAMRELQAWADLSYRDLERFCGGVCAYSTFWKALRDDTRLPKLVLVNALVVACGGTEDDYQRWATAWRRIKRADRPKAAAPDLPSDPW
ncbi:hypothetical protein ACFOVU_07035 [Nocardiopsis sediminis]|uniref:XRE family transcriptional regulator n=1 Tax=Nocardiopsis sediminis TaxID=1778267 RepID=A0ABV8FHP5_9ACTN